MKVTCLYVFRRQCSCSAVDCVVCPAALGLVALFLGIYEFMALSNPPHSHPRLSYFCRSRAFMGNLWPALLTADTTLSTTAPAPAGPYVSCVLSFAHHHFFFVGWTLGMQLRISTTTILYDKILRLRLSSLGQVRHLKQHMVGMQNNDRRKPTCLLLVVVGGCFVFSRARRRRALNGRF